MCGLPRLVAACRGVRGLVASSALVGRPYWADGPLPQGAAVDFGGWGFQWARFAAALSSRWSRPNWNAQNGNGPCTKTLPPGGVDILSGTVDAAIVISNDSDLRFPIQESRRRVPVGTVNPGLSRLAGDLRGNPDDGAGNHWWYRLDKSDFTSCQLPDPAGQASKPAGW